MTERERPDWLIEEPEDAYHARRGEYLTSHGLADFRACPLLYRQKLGLVPEIDSIAYMIGRVAHTLILEGDEAFGNRYAVGGPINPKTGNAYGPTSQAFQRWADEQEGEVIDQKTADQARILADAVADHLVAQDLFWGGWAEGTIRIDTSNPRMQARIDYYKPGMIIDLKTCQNLTFFEYDARRYGYLYQLAFYRDIVRRAADSTAQDVYLVAVEKQPPYRVGVWHICDDVLDAYEGYNRDAIADMRRCIETGTWPTGYETIREWTATNEGRSQ